MRYVLTLSIVLTIVLTSVGITTVPTLVAQVMSSGSYQIQSDSINMHGGYSTSTNYSLESTGGELATGIGTSTNYALFAGYQQMHEVYISMSAVAHVVMSPTLPGITGGVASGTTAVNVTTDSGAGYQLTIEAENEPAMQSYALAEAINDYVPAGSDPDFLFTTDVNDVHFGFSPEGTDISLRYQDNTSVCGVSGGDTTDRCWDGLATTSKVIAESTDANHPLGATTTIKFRVGLGGGVTVPAGSYVATTTITALPL